MCKQSPLDTDERTFVFYLFTVYIGVARKKGFDIVDWMTDPVPHSVFLSGLYLKFSTLISELFVDDRCLQFFFVTHCHDFSASFEACSLSDPLPKVLGGWFGNRARGTSCLKLMSKENTKPW